MTELIFVCLDPMAIRALPQTSQETLGKFLVSIKTMTEINKHTVIF